MIYALGLDADPTFRYFVATAAAYGDPLTVINLRAVVQSGSWRLALPDDGHSYVVMAGHRVPLDPTASYLVRLINLATVQKEPRRAYRWNGLVDALGAWLEHIHGRVINRPGGRGDNFSKPLHEYALQRHGFAVPASLTSSDRARLMAFAAAGPTLVKAVAAARVTSRVVHAAELATFEAAQGPVHLQRYVAGADVRVHVVGRRLHAEMATPRAATEDRGATQRVMHAPHALPDALAAQVTRATAAFGLVLAGWDFRVSSEGAYWCLEANPLPGYDAQDYRLGGAITRSLLEALRPPGSRDGDVRR